MSGGYGYEVRSYNNTFSAPVAEKWKKPSYAESDHAARQPYIPSTESYVVKRERIIEKVHTPTVIEYSRVSPVKYGVERSRWGSAVPSAVDEPPRKVEEFITQVKTEVAQGQLHLLRPPPRLLSEGARSDYSKQSNYPSSEYGQPASDRWSRSSSPILAPVAEYKHGSNKSEYGGQNTNPWGMSRPSSEVGHTEQTRGQNTNPWGMSRPSSEVGHTEQTQSPIRPGYLGNTSRVPEQVQALPAPVAEYKHSPNSPLKNHTTENNPWVRNSQPGLVRSENWRQTPNSSYTTTQSPQTGYSDYKGKEMDKDRPGGYSYHYDDTPKDYSSEKYKHMSAELSPQLARGAWTRPGPGGWATTTTKITTLTRPTNDIKEAVNYLAGALQQSSLTHASPQQYYNNTLGGPKMDQYTDTIDSREAQRRYGNMSGSTMANESYSATIDSREALRKHGGAAV